MGITILSLEVLQGFDRIINMYKVPGIVVNKYRYHWNLEEARMTRKVHRGSLEQVFRDLGIRPWVSRKNS